MTALAHRQTNIRAHAWGEPQFLCPECDGDGTVRSQPFAHPMRCLKCGGMGIVPASAFDDEPDEPNDDGYSAAVPDAPDDSRDDIIRDDRDEDAASEAAWRDGSENGRAL